MAGWRANRLAQVLLIVGVTAVSSIAPLAAQAGAAAQGAATGATTQSQNGPLCPAGDTQMTIVNNSAYPDSQVYGVVTGATITQTNLVNQSLALSPNYPATGSPHSYYFCEVSGNGRVWLSLGAPLSSNFGGGQQPSPASEPVRFSIIEFGPPGSGGSLDSSNVNNFDFAVNVHTYGTPGSATAAQSEVFRANTCQIVNAMRSTVSAAGSVANLGQVELDSNGQFVRMVSPTTSATGWPSMTPYITSLAASLPLVTSGFFAGDRGPLVINDNYAGDPGTHANAGWFQANAYFDSSGDVTVDAGLHVAGLGAAGSAPGGPFTALPNDISVSEAVLATGVYQQGFTYGVGNGNDIYAWLWGDLTTAYDYGYWGSQYGSGTNSYQFAPSPGGPVLPNGQPAFTPLRTIPYPSAPGGLAYNLYAAALGPYTEGYTFPYNERWGRGGYNTSPLLNMPANGEVRISIPAEGWNGGVGSTTCAAGPGPGPGSSAGYREVASDGGIFAFGNDNFYGSMGGRPLNAPMVAMASTPDGQGYWEVASDGGIFAFGDAGFYGSMGGQRLTKPVMGIAATPSGRGYWEAASDGGVFAFGDARYFGSMAGHPLNLPMMGIASTPDGGGYWEVALDGGVFAFGDARFFGSMGGQRLNQPVTGLAADPDSGGYWLVAADGGIFAFGTASFFGSMGGQHLNRPINGLAATGDGEGYWEVATDGGIFTFGDAAFEGSMGGQSLNAPVVGIG